MNMLKRFAVELQKSLRSVHSKRHLANAYILMVLLSCVSHQLDWYVKQVMQLHSRENRNIMKLMLINVGVLTGG